MTCYECGLAIESPPFTIKYEDDDWPDGYLCSKKCLDDFVVVTETEALLDEVAVVVEAEALLDEVAP